VCKLLLLQVIPFINDAWSSVKKGVNIFVSTLAAYAALPAITDDVIVLKDDHTRFDSITKTAAYELLVSDHEIVKVSGTFPLTLHAATTEGIIKKIYNEGTGLVTLVGTINGETNLLLYPNDSVELITDGTGWKY